MATWRDGPRYAPVERPFGFAEPLPSVSLAGEPPAPSVAPAPEQPPVAYGLDASATPLDAIAPAVGEVRDPRQPFANHGAALTAGTPGMATLSSSSPADRQPTTPFAIATSAHPQLQTTWAPPAASATPVRSTQPVAWRDVLNAAYPPLLIALVLAGIIASVSTLMALLTYSVAAMFLMSRVRFRFTQLRTANYIIVGVLVVIIIASAVMNTTMYNISLGLPWWIFLGSWGLGGIDLFLQYQGLRFGERPDVHQ